ncbi:33 kDa ribonucleoprotein, chloroplastic [Linum perenne]
MAASLLRVSSSLAAPSFSDRLPSSSSSSSFQSSFGCSRISFSPPPFHSFHLSLTRTKVCASPAVDSSSIEALVQTLANIEGKKEGEEEKEVSKDRVYVSNLPWLATAEDIRSLFLEFGTVVDVEVPRHSKGKNRGLAFVTMGSPEEALSAMKKLDGYEYQGRVLRTSYVILKNKRGSALNSNKRGPTAFCLFVSNLSYEAKEKDVKQVFVEGGANVVRVDIIYNINTRRSAGYGFVFFKSEKDAEEAISANQDKELLGRPLRVARAKKYFRQPIYNDSPSDEGTAASTEINAEEAADTAASAANETV